MKIKSMHLENYRCFRKLDITFDEQLTVLVGVNGAGKTAVLDALGVFLKGAEGGGVGPYYIDVPPTDTTIGCAPKTLNYSVLIRLESGKECMYTAHSLDFKDFGILMMDEYAHVFAAYMSGRIVPDKDLLLERNPNNVQKDKFRFSRKIDYKSALVWFDTIDAAEARRIRAEGHDKKSPILTAVREALSKALLGNYEHPMMNDEIPSELVIKEKESDHYIKVSQLSAGYRAMLALIMDLTYRMAQVLFEREPNESILQTPAIVLIDEVELHLHPSWQQTVLTTLMDIFPNTQFIVTTHSPQVLTAIKNKHIRILENGEAFTVPGQTEGAEASRLLEDIFDVTQRPNRPIVQKLNEYANLICNEKKWDTPEAIKLRQELDAHYGGHEPRLTEMDLRIENLKWERGL